MKSWQECAYLGVKCNGYPTIMCVRNMGGSVLEIFYTPKVWDELSQYMSRHDVKILAPEIKYPWQKIRPGKKTGQTECVLRDIQGKLEINEIEAYQKHRKKQKKDIKMMCLPMVIMSLMFYLICSFINGSFIRYLWFFPVPFAFWWLIMYIERKTEERKWIVDKNGIEVISTADKEKNFYKWQDMTRVGVCGEFSENPNLRIFFSVKGNHRKNKIQFTEKRYEEFLKYVPEGKETDPMTNDFRIRLLWTQSYWRMYNEH